ncbi:hypothetical protein N7533_010730 [Penicillium manginii]|uniref:uncharacterized protein n=1 Tax=Penicillium manginii TaxID=203109 RepID=UPI00254746BB|nr:uncharacterized protein N7533_010730 [Penicillium manginii]KAJ5741321.1 hypothetical protein N7533_010730 [Penicillium manginii]
MLRFLRRLQTSAGSQRVVDRDCCGIATAAAGQHARPGKIANRPRDVLSEKDHRGGKGSKRGEKARGGGSHGSRANRKAAMQLEEALKESKRRSQEGMVPPTFEEWKT